MPEDNSSWIKKMLDNGFQFSFLSTDPMYEIGKWKTVSLGDFQVSLQGLGYGQV